MLRRGRSLVFVVLLVTLVAALCACASSGGEEPANSDARAKSETPRSETSAEPDSSPEEARKDGPEDAPKEARTGGLPVTADTVRLAYRKTKAKTAAMAFDVSISGMPGGADLEIEGEGVVDLQGENAEYGMRIGGTAGMAGSGEFRVRQIGTTLYERLPRELRSAVPGGKPWIRMDLDDFDSRGGSGDGLAVGGAGANDFSGQLSYLRGVSSSVEEIGRATVRGAPATHYRAEVDIRKITGEEKPPQRVIKHLREQLGSNRLPVEVWIGDDGLLRRFEMTLPIPLPDEGFGDVSLDIKQEFYDFGTPVVVRPPPAGQTTDFTRVMSELRNSFQQGA